MTECNSLELQDCLPDYMAGTLDELAMARVSNHLLQCVACAADLRVLQTVRGARPRVSVPDVQRIVAALPEVGPQGRRAQSVPGSSYTTPPLVRQRTLRRRVLDAPVWRMAAVLAVIIAGGTSLLMVPRGSVTVAPSAPTVGVGGGGMIAGAPSQPNAESVAVYGGPTASPVTVSVSYGDLGDYTEQELQRMLDRLDRWDGATSTEPLPGVPIVTLSGGTSL